MASLVNPTVPTPLENGSTIKRFRLLECAGEDLDGFLYRAEDLQAHRQVSIKEFFPPGLARRSGERVEPMPGTESDYSRMLARFIVVTNQLACIDHPALMRVDDYWLQDGTVYVQMPWYAGQSLQDVLAARQTPVEPAVLEGWLGACAEALKVVHRSRDLHGGLSPDRIMVLEDGQVVLSPLSTEQPMSMLAPHAAAGSEALAAMAASAGLMKRPAAVSQRSLPPWVALEQTELSAGEWTCGPWTDVYALAAIASLAITGKMPPNVFQRVEGVPAMTLRPAADRGYRPEFLEAVERGLSLYPAGRPHSVSAFMTALGLKEMPAASARIDAPGQPASTSEAIEAAEVPELAAPAAAVSDWVEVEPETVAEAPVLSAVPAAEVEIEVAAAVETGPAKVAAVAALVEPVAPAAPVAPIAETSAPVEAANPQLAAPTLHLVPPVEKPSLQSLRAKDRPGVVVWGSAAAAVVALGVFGPKVFDTWTGSTAPAAKPVVQATQPAPQVATAPAVLPAAAAKKTAPAASASVAAAHKPAATASVPAPAAAHAVAPAVAQAAKPRPEPKARPEPRKAEPRVQVARPVVPPVPVVRPRRPEVIEASVAVARPVVARPTTLAHQDQRPATVRVSDACADALIRRTLDPSAASDTSPRNTCR